MSQNLLAFPPNTLVGNSRYRIDGQLGRGGAGVVYLATHLELNKQVALKVSAATNTGGLQALRDEARLLFELRHAHLPRVIDFFSEGHLPCLVMEYIPGQDLEQRFSDHGGAMPQADVLQWADQVLDALAYLHAQQPPIVHRDIKPSNIRLKPSGDAVLVDFGIAKVGGAETHTQMLAQGMGTPPFAPFEQYGGSHTDTYSDVYALGATLYVLLTGVLPPDAITRQTHDTLELRQDQTVHVQEGVLGVILKAMARDPRARFQNAHAFRTALAMASQGAGPTPTGASPPCPRCGSRPITATALFCHACGARVLLRFPHTNRLLTRSSDLVTFCDDEWSAALNHVKNRALDAWLETYGEHELGAHLQRARARYPNDPEAALEVFLRPGEVHDLAAAPAEIDFGTYTAGQGPEFQLALHVSQPHGLVHGTVRTEGGWLSVTPTAIRTRAGQSLPPLLIRVGEPWLASPETQRTLTGAVVIETNHGVLRVPARLTVANPPQPHLPTASIEFGRADTRQRPGGTAVIMNVGGGTMSGTVRGGEPWITVDAQHARYTLGHREHHTVAFGVAMEQITRRGVHRGTLVWELDVGTRLTHIQIEVTPPYLLDRNDPRTALAQPSDLIGLCDCERGEAPHRWEHGIALLNAGKITAALAFFELTEVLHELEHLMQRTDANVGLETLLRRLGARPPTRYRDNSSDVLKQITGWLSRKQPKVEYGILNTSARGYLHGFVRPLVSWIDIPEPRFGCLPGQEAVVPLYPNYAQRDYGSLFEVVLQ
jgi:hypothetical protein